MAPSCAISQDLGPRWRAAQIFIRWSRGGVWERLLGFVQEHGVQLGMVFLDGTNMRASEGGRGCETGDLRPSETIVKLLADRVTDMDGTKIA